MRKWLAFVIAIFSFSTSLGARADLKAGQEKAETVCLACHGPKGNSVNPLWPKLAGQHADYMVKQMKAYKVGKDRNNPSMAPMMAPLTEQDMINVASYYSTQKRSIEKASKALFKRGERIYRGGDDKKNISACIACHGPRGMGNAQAGFPSLSGQHAAYIVEELNDYKGGLRKTDLNSIMRDISQKMSKEDMQAVASYISGLH